MEPTLRFLSLQMDEWLQALEPDSSSPVRLTISAFVRGSRPTLKLCADLVRAGISVNGGDQEFREAMALAVARNDLAFSQSTDGLTDCPKDYRPE